MQIPFLSTKRQRQNHKVNTVVSAGGHCRQKTIKKLDYI